MKESSSRSACEIIRKPQDFCRLELEGSHIQPNSSSCSSSLEVINNVETIIFESDDEISTKPDPFVFTGGLIAETEAHFSDMMESLKGRKVHSCIQIDMKIYILSIAV